MGDPLKEKELLERRLVLPLAEADLAEESGVVTPRAVVPFGSPGTGKATVAKAIASRLECVKVFPSRLAAVPRGLAGALRETFLEIAELEHAVSSTRWRNLLRCPTNFIRALESPFLHTAG